MGRAGFERPKWGPKPKGLGCFRRQSPCSLFRTRTGGRSINGSGGRVVQMRKLRLQRGEGKRRITHRVSESQVWALGLWSVCPE